jgi:hypothetical protein
VVGQQVRRDGGVAAAVGQDGECRLFLMGGRLDRVSATGTVRRNFKCNNAGPFEGGAGHFGNAGQARCGTRRRGPPCRSGPLQQDDGLFSEVRIGLLKNLRPSLSPST